MSDYEMKLPPLGEDAPDEATLSFFFVDVGDDVSEGDDFCEMVTDKATFTVPAPVSGSVKALLAGEDDKVKVGQALAILETG